MTWRLGGLYGADPSVDPSQFNYLPAGQGASDGLVLTYLLPYIRRTPSIYTGTYIHTHHVLRSRAFWVLGGLDKVPISRNFGGCSEI